ncbi:hypothetical protein [Undibacterium pigrum]|uniref:Uncharacterized protein n=1 Tax=Undibacterium pigrum TaxID=401470 RepID=A0A318IKI3_9BURK|nr:hypothetical protein [Undibacterium pigrum]PXX33737.1 hypothetical protein DFR42_12812 [Undibacterium pigrum]
MLSDENIPQEEAQCVISAVLIRSQRPGKNLTLNFAARKYEIKLSDSGYPIDNHWDTKDLCILELNAETTEITVTIVNEMPWLRQDMLK